MKKVKFYCVSEESDEYIFANDASEIDLQEAADLWVRDNIGGYYEVIEEDDTIDHEMI